MKFKCVHFKKIRFFPKVPDGMGDYSWCRRQGGQRQGTRNPSQKTRTGLQGRSLLSQGGQYEYNN